MIREINQFFEQDFFQIVILHNTVLQYISAVLIFLVTFIVAKIFKSVILGKAKRFAQRTRMPYDDILIDVLDTVDGPFFTAVGLYVASIFLNIPKQVGNILLYIIIIISVMYTAKALQKMIVFFLNRFIDKKDDEHMIDMQVKSFVNTIASVIIWVLAGLVILQNIGFNVTTLLGGLGVMGIAVSFALQSILGDIFAYISIFFDKPFKIGDFIIVGGDMGVVEHIGIKTTRIKTLQGQELIMTNKELTESRVNNYKRMQRRRIVFTFGVTYETSSAKLKKIPELVKKAIEEVKDATFDRAHFYQYGDFSLNFEVVYYVESPDYNIYMDIQQNINFSLKDALEKQNIEFAYPTQTIYMGKTASSNNK
ncbi:MAG: mechanosensitive ion channel family protein [Patescibacteria group bacterium]